MKTLKAVRPLPPPLSATISVPLETPDKRYEWVPSTDPEPSTSLTSPLEEVQSPQSIDAVCVSSSPGSVKVALAVTGVPTSTGSTGAVIGPTAGGTLVIVAAVLAALVRFPSDTVRVTV